MKKSQEEIFNETLESSKVHLRKAKEKGVVVNSKNDSYYIIPVLEKHGYTTWEKVNKEATLIVDNKSQLPSKVRAVIDHVHTHVLLQYQKQFSDGNDAV